MGNTKKVGSTGRFKGRYGVGIKKRVLEVENKAKDKAPCPYCGFDTIKREAPGLFSCRKCNSKFTGGAYYTQTLVGKAIGKMVSQKSFLENTAQLVNAKESSFSDIEREVEAALMGKGSDSVVEEVQEEKQRKSKKKNKKAKEADSSAAEESAVFEESNDESSAEEDN